MQDRATPESFVEDWIVVLAMFAVLFFYSFWVEPAQLTVRHVEINKTGVHMKVVFMSDFQRINSDPAFVQRAVELANAENPDIVLLGGDYVESGLSELPSIAPLSSLRAGYGVYGVLGNHDYGMATDSNDPRNEAMAAEVCKFLEAGGIRLLRNENVRAGNITIIALDDYWAGKRDERMALQGNPSGYRILLSHNQEELMISDAAADLYLFGHTHCGQLRLPGIGSVPKLFGFKGDYEAGHYALNGSDVYTTCGLSWGPRLLAPPEVTVIELN